MDFFGFYSQHVQDLKKAGSQYLGWCPFHADEGSKMKGFSLNPDNGLWKCFSCDKRGNVITFCKEKGIGIEKAPNYDPNYRRYSYGGGYSKMKPTPEAKKQGKGEFWDKPKKDVPLPKDMKPYNFLAIDQARELERALWICEGEKDTETLHEAGELAIGIPSSTHYNVLDNISLDDIPEVIIAMDNDDAGRKATETIKDILPFAKVVIWSSIYPKGWDVTDLKEEFDGYDMDIGFVNQLKKLVKEDIWESVAELADTFLTRTERKTEFIKTGFAQLDEKIDGLLPGGLHVIQGSSSIGKTTFCNQLAFQVCKINPDLPVFFFSLEDSLQTIEAMIYSKLSHDMDKPIENKVIRQGGDGLSSNDREVLGDIKKQVVEICKNYYLAGREPDINVKTIRDGVEKKLLRMRKETAVIIVDYLQVLPTPRDERLSSLMDRVDFNLHELQCLARDINGVVILTSSITKEDIRAKDRTPGEVKGRGSANILFTPRRLFELIEKEAEGFPGYREVDLFVVKNSEGEKGATIPFIYYPEYSKFKPPITFKSN